MRFIKLSIIGVVVLLLSACGHYHGRYGGKYYSHQAQVSPPLAVPAGTKSPVEEAYYPIPWKVSHYPHQKFTLLPPDPTYRRYLAERKHHKKKG